MIQPIWNRQQLKMYFRMLCNVYALFLKLYLEFLSVTSLSNFFNAFHTDVLDKLAYLITVKHNKC